MDVLCIGRQGGKEYIKRMPCVECALETLLFGECKIWKTHQWHTMVISNPLGVVKIYHIDVAERQMSYSMGKEFKNNSKYLKELFNNGNYVKNIGCGIYFSKQIKKYEAQRDRIKRDKEREECGEGTCKEEDNKTQA